MSSSSSEVTIRTDPSLFSMSDRRDYLEKKNQLKRKYERDLKALERKYQPIIHVSLAEQITDNLESFLQSQRQSEQSQVIPSDKKRIRMSVSPAALEDIANSVIAVRTRRASAAKEPKTSRSAKRPRSPTYLTAASFEHLPDCELVKDEENCKTIPACRWVPDLGQCYPIYDSSQEHRRLSRIAIQRLLKPE